MSEFSVERLATDLAIENYLARQPRQGAIGTLYVLVLVVGVLLAVELTVLFVQVALQETRLTRGLRLDARTHAASGNATGTAGEGSEGAGGEAGNDTNPGLGEYRLKDFYLECALDTSRQRTGPGELVGCGQLVDSLLAQAFNGDSNATDRMATRVGTADPGRQRSRAGGTSP